MEHPILSTVLYPFIILLYIEVKLGGVFWFCFNQLEFTCYILLHTFQSSATSFVPHLSSCQSCQFTWHKKRINSHEVTSNRLSRKFFRIISWEEYWIRICQREGTEATEPCPQRKIECTLEQAAHLACVFKYANHRIQI